MPVSFGFTDVGEQAWMVLDRVRLDAFRRAIEEVVRPGDVVLDVGTGNGLLALLAARAGAKKVFAVERTGAIELAIEHAKENGLADVIEVVRADVLELTSDALVPRPDVVVCEMLGSFAPDEGIHLAMRQAKRLAKEGARTIPLHYEVFVAPACPGAYADELCSLADVGGVSMRAMATRLRQRVTLARVDRDELAGPGVSCGRLEVVDETPTLFSAKVHVEQAGPVQGVVAWFRAHLSLSVVLDSGPEAPPTHWNHTFFPLDPPLECASGDALEVELRPRLVGQRGTWAWRVRRGDDVRRGDAMGALLGGKEDTLAALGLKTPAFERLQPNATLAAWTAMLTGGAPRSLAEMITRLQAAMPERFVDEDAARREAKQLLRAAGALS